MGIMSLMLMPEEQKISSIEAITVPGQIVVAYYPQVDDSMHLVVNPGALTKEQLFQLLLQAVDEIELPSQQKLDGLMGLVAPLCTKW